MIVDKDQLEAPPKLTTWVNEPTLRELKQDLTSAYGYHSTQITKIKEWLDNLNIKPLPKCKGRSSVQPQLIRKQAEWRYAALSEPFLATQDIFRVDPVSWEDRKAARQNALVLNNQFQTKIDRTRFIDNYIRAAVNEGTAIVKVGWKYEEKEVEEEIPVFQYQPIPPEAMEQYQAQIQELQRAKVEEPDSFTQLDPALVEMLRMYEEENAQLIPSLVQMRKQKRTKAIVNCPSVELCDYRSVIIDPTCEGDLDKASFVIYNFSSSISALKETGLYKNLEYIKPDDSGYLNQRDEDFLTGEFGFFKDTPRQKLSVYEYWGYWDIDGTGIVKPIVATWVGGVLIRMEENPYPDGKLPFVVVPYLPVKNSVYGEPDGALLVDHQKVVGAVTRGLIDLLGKSANSQTGFPKGALDEVNLRKYSAGQDYQYNPNANPQAIFQHKYPEIPVSVLNFLQLQHADAEALTGVKAYSTGGGITGAGLGPTASGVRGALDAASKREMGILRRLSNGIIQIGRKIIAMNSQFLQEEEIVRITNEQFIKVRRDDLAGNFDLRLSISTAESDDAKAQELAFMLQTMGNNMDAGMSKLILTEIAHLRKMPDLAHQIETYQPQPTPEEQRIQQLNIAKLEAEVELLKAQAKEASTKGDLNTQKIPVESARANEMQNTADLKTQEFMNKMNNKDLQDKLTQEANKQALDEESKDNEFYRKLMLEGAKGINDGLSKTTDDLQQGKGIGETNL